MLILPVGSDDYASGSFNVTIPAGQANTSFSIEINDDDIYEQNEQFIVTIDQSSLLSGVHTGSPNMATVVIVDDGDCKYILATVSNYL